jgi:N-acetylglucosaminyl-diphospho-decaprenol L-rhamnosyltransferase
MTPRLSIVIVSWNCAADLDRCLNSVFGCTNLRDLEVIVVDNGSTDGSPAVAQKFDAVRLLANAENRGAGGGRNQGIAAAQADLVLLLDSDAYVVDAVIERAVQALEARPEIDVLGCELRFPGGRRQFSAERAMSIRLTLLRDLWLYRLLPRSSRAGALLGGYYDSDEEVEPDWLAAPFMLVRRRVFAACGGFNESVFPEDSEFGIRISRAGHRILYAPRVGFVYHSGSARSPTDELAALRMHHRAGIKAYRLLNGPLLACGYWLACLVGASVRWTAYSTGRRMRSGNPFYATQASFYGHLVSIYATMPFLRS